MALREARIKYNFDKLPIEQCSFCLKTAHCFDMPFFEDDKVYRVFQCEECYKKANYIPDEYAHLEAFLPHSKFRPILCLAVELSELGTYNLDHNCCDSVSDRTNNHKRKG